MTRTEPQSLLAESRFAGLELSTRRLLRHRMRRAQPQWSLIPSELAVDVALNVVERLDVPSPIRFRFYYFEFGCGRTLFAALFPA